jgi:dethiobiotin synthetase
MAGGLFITATSTGIGKTVISALLCRRLLESGAKVCYHKPVQTGAAAGTEGLYSPDARFVERACLEAGGRGIRTACSYLLLKAASPHFASRLEGVEISLSRIREDYTRLSSGCGCAVVEGAGGLYVPLNERLQMMADIPRELGLNTVLVAEAGLGTINHTGLTARYALEKGLNIAAIILLSGAKGKDELEEENRDVIARLTGTKSVFLIPRLEGVDTEAGKTGDLGEKLVFLPGSKTLLEWMK